MLNDKNALRHPHVLDGSVSSRPYQEVRKALPQPGYAIDRWIVRRFIKQLGAAPVRWVLWNGEAFTARSAPPIASVRIQTRFALLRLLAHPDLQFGECYTEGTIDVEGDLPAFLEAVHLSAPEPGRVRNALERWLAGCLRSIGLRRARQNVHHHYDIGNDFYRLWLDSRMVYTCAYFASPSVTLEEAQEAKLEHVCRKLRLAAGETVVEAGCGWGALALHMARKYGVSVVAYNISREQIDYARAQAEKEGLSDRVQFIEDDYRNISGTYDVFVSVGMLEHVGPRHYKEFGRLIARCLKSSGRGLIHSIGRSRPRVTSAWLRKRVFPDGYTPSLKEMMSIFEPNGFAVLDVENLRLHYAKTLEHWLARFEESADRVADMFDEEFVRAWRLYLAGSVAAFRASSMHLYQVVFAPARNNDVPWTRAHIYQRP